MNQSFRRAAVGIPGFCAFFNLYGPQSLLPSLAREFDATPAQISLTVTATTLAIAISAPFAGAIADVLGRKRVIAAAMVLATFPLVMIALAPSLHALVFWRFVLGLRCRRSLPWWCPTSARNGRPRKQWARWVSTWRRPAWAVSPAGSSPGCSPTWSAGVRVS